MNNRAIYSCITFIIFILPTSLQAQECNSLAQINWLLGKWQSKDTQKTISEHWQQISAKTFEGRGEAFKLNTLVSSETLRLVEMSDSIFYLAKVTDNELPVVFKLVSCSASQATFENMKHDFPKRIAYQLQDSENMEVNVSDGKNDGFSIKFKHIQ